MYLKRFISDSIDAILITILGSIVITMIFPLDTYINSGSIIAVIGILMMLRDVLDFSVGRAIFHLKLIDSRTKNKPSLNIKCIHGLLIYFYQIDIILSAIFRKYPTFIDQLTKTEIVIDKV
jgi:hypothetical protein